MKYVIISNRLPVTVKRTDAGVTFTRSGGGLATGLDSLETDAPKHWIGWCGVQVDDPAERADIDRRLGAQLLHPVCLNEQQIADFYEGYSNSTIWPLCHYFYSNIVFDDAFRRAYWEVNELFANEAVKVVEPGDLVWVQDYQLMLLPGLIRERIPDVGIGYSTTSPSRPTSCSAACRSGPTSSGASSAPTSSASIPTITCAISSAPSTAF